MAKIYITEHIQPGSWGGNMLPAARMPALASQTLAIGGVSVQSAPFHQDVFMICVHTDSVCSIDVGADPLATTSSKRMAANTTEYFHVWPGHKLAAISNV